MADTDHSSSDAQPLPPSAMSHVSLGTNDFNRAKTFYEVVLATLDIREIMSHPGASAYGKIYPEFWVQTPIDGAPASLGNGTHFGFFALSKEQVHAFFDAAVAAGAQPDGAPGPREEYGAPYYGCFVRDLDGHKIEAAYWDFAVAADLGMG